MTHYMSFIGLSGVPIFGAFVGLGVLFIALWVVFWKGSALWIAAERKEPWWFVALLLLNTLGILEIIYLFVITKAGLPKFREIFKSKAGSASTKSEEKS